MIASDYPVTFGYGATDGVYYGPNGLIGPYHRGDDRAMPVGTPVVVNGTVIGLSGDGNGRYGAHLHIGKFVGGADENPQGKGFELGGAVVTRVLNSYDDAINGKYVWIADNRGATWCYLHLSRVDVTVGQRPIKETEVIMPTEKDVQDYFRVYVKRQPTAAEIGDYTSKSWRYLTDKILKFVINQYEAKE